MSLPQLLLHIEKCHVYLAIDNFEQAKAEVLHSIKLLNLWSKHNLGQNPQIEKYISKYLLHLHDTVVSKNLAPLSTSQKLTWLSSKLAYSNETCYPILQFDSSLNSLNAVFINIDDTEYEELPLVLPRGIDATYEPISNDSICKNINDLADSCWETDPAKLALLYQDLLQNCSFVSSFLSLSDQNYPLVEIITPHCASKRYAVALHFNGSQRKVYINNKLPKLTFSNRNIIMKSIDDESSSISKSKIRSNSGNSDNDGDRSTSTKSLYWPALIEKAFLKVMAKGYAIDGSNMANDTYMLSGWLPEIIKLKQGSLPILLKKLWSLKKLGKLVLGVGTAQLSTKLSMELNLISEHDYLMIDFNLEEGNECITLKNSWLTPDMKNRYITTSDYSQFKYLYVNWKPYSLGDPTVESFIYSERKKNLADLPQFQITAMDECHILLERHFSTLTKDKQPLEQQKQQQLLQQQQQQQPWTKITVYDSEYKVLAPTQYPIVQILETNNRLQLIKLKPGIYTMAIWSNKLGNFSLSSFANTQIRKLQSQYYFTHKIQGAWNSDTCGGNWTLSTFLNNPQYEIYVSELTLATLCIYTERDDAVNIHLVHSDNFAVGKRICQFHLEKSLIKENYNQAFQLYSVQLQPGYYRLIVSTYQPCTNAYSLILNSLAELSVLKVPDSMALYSTSTKVPWNNKNRLKLPIIVDTANTVAIVKLSHLQTGNFPLRHTDYRPGMRCSIFNAITKQPLQINEAFDNDTFYGLYVDQKFASTGQYILLIERFEIGTGICHVEIGSNFKLQIEQAQFV